MSLFFAELRKVWGNRLFPLLLAVLAAANLLLLWMGTRPTAGQPSAAAYRAVGAQLDGLTMEEKGAYLHGKYTEPAAATCKPTATRTLQCSTPTSRNTRTKAIHCSPTT